MGHDGIGWLGVGLGVGKEHERYAKVGHVFVDKEQNVHSANRRLRNVDAHGANGRVNGGEEYAGLPNNGRLTACEDHETYGLDG